MAMSSDARDKVSHLNSVSCWNGISTLKALLIRESPDRIARVISEEWITHVRVFNPTTKSVPILSFYYHPIFIILCIRFDNASTKLEGSISRLNIDDKL